MVTNWEDQKKYEEAREMTYGSSYRIVAWGIFIFCCAAVYPLVMIPTELKGGIYNRMAQESQNYLIQFKEFKKENTNPITKEAQGEIKALKERLDAVENYLNSQDKKRFKRFFAKPEIQNDKN